MGSTIMNRQVILLKLFCGTLLLLAEAGVLQGRRMGGEDVWGEGGMMMREVVHAARRLQSAPYCVVAGGADTSKLQDALDWACGAVSSNGGGVDCSAILQTGSCYNPDTIQAHASYAFNYYYVQQNGADGSCSFGGLATTTSTDPSSGSCVYPSLGSGVSPTTPSSSNFTTPTSSNSTGFNSPTTGSSSHAMGSGAGLSWLHTCWSLSVVVLLVSQL